MPISQQPEVQSSAGLLPYQHLVELAEQGLIHAEIPIEAGQLQPASLDLRLGPVAYRVQASFLPGDATVEERLGDLQMHNALDLTRPCLLERGCVYIIPLEEELRLPRGMAAKANPKSTTGRLDVFTRLITDRATEFDRVPEGYHGKLYVEVVPRTFSIVAQRGTRLNQLRVYRGRPGLGDAELWELHGREPLVYRGEEPSVPIIYEVDGIVHYGVANMPGAVPRTSTLALTNATFPYAATLARLGWKEACRRDPALRQGLNIVHGSVVHPGVADAFKLPLRDVEEVLE